MKKLKLFKARLSFFIVALVMYGSYRLGQGESQTIQFLSVALGIVGGIGFAEAFVNWLAGYYWIRKWVVGQHFIEGYWDLRTEPSDKGENDKNNNTVEMTNRGVMLIEYDHAADEHSVVVTRLDRNDQKFCTSSENCYMSETVNAVRYLNYFRIHDKRNSTMCVCSGELFRVRRERDLVEGCWPRFKIRVAKLLSVSKPVDTFSAVMYSPGSGARNQYATRIHDDQIPHLSDEKKSWIADYLRKKKGEEQKGRDAKSDGLDEG